MFHTCYEAVLQVLRHPIMVKTVAVSTSRDIIDSVSMFDYSLLAVSNGTVDALDTITNCQA